MKKFVHYGTVEDGSVCYLPYSIWPLLKVCDENGHGALADLRDGHLYTLEELTRTNCLKVSVVARSIDDFYHTAVLKNEDEEDSNECMRESLGENWY